MTFYVVDVPFVTTEAKSGFPNSRSTISLKISSLEQSSIAEEGDMFANLTFSSMKMDRIIYNYAKYEHITFLVQRNSKKNFKKIKK